MNKSSFFKHPTSEIDEGVTIGSGTKIWHFSHILENTHIGKNCSLGQNVVVGPNVHIGNNCKVQNNVSLYDGVHLEDDVFLGPSCVFTNVINPRSFIERKTEFKKTLIQQGASIGANATIICGVKIGSYSMVGAGAVVTKDVQPYTVVIGNPAKEYCKVSLEGYLLNADLECTVTGKSYIYSNNQLIEKND